MNYSLGNTCFLKALSQKMQLPSVFLTPKGFEDCGEHQSRFTLRCFEKPIKCAGLPAATHTKVKFAGPLAGIHFQVNPKAGGRVDGSIKRFPSNHRQTSRPNLLFVGVERKARTSGGGGGRFIGLFPDLKCPLGSGGGGLKVLVRSVGDGKGVKEFGVFVLGDHAKAPSQCKSFDRASERCIRRGGQEQGKLIGSIMLFGVVTEGILIVGDGFGN